MLSDQDQSIDDLEQVIDMEEGLRVFGNDKEIYHDMLAKFQLMTFDEQMNNLVESMIKRNYEGVFQSSHILKGASSYIGALLFSEASKQLQFAGQYFHYKEGNKITFSTNFDRDYQILDLYMLFLILINEAKRLIIRLHEIQRVTPNIDTLVQLEDKVKQAYPEFQEMTEQQKQNNRCDCLLF